ncbi:hypothetical protein AB1Y20_023230 [Prymnesium parvum]|uniref:Cilia- and flagella-associated protein 418 n=1 Tax=Prymnesium parvum TaxID=97485 RepID=A0AB34JCJ7_PRYPA
MHIGTSVLLNGSSKPGGGMDADDGVDALLSELDGLLTDEASLKARGALKVGREHTAAPDQPCLPQQPPMHADVLTERNGTTASHADDIDSLIADICSPGSLSHESGEFAGGACVGAVVSRGSSIVAPKFPRSVSSPPEQDTCETNLRCARCDFKVLKFAGRSWVPSADYMFFRNFMPDREKLGQKLTASDGEDAFACQCSWATVSATRRRPEYEFWFTIQPR